MTSIQLQQQQFRICSQSRFSPVLRRTVPLRSSITPNASTNDAVSVKISHGPRNSRFVLGSLLIQASMETIWNSLTDYDHLDEFIPSLAENKCLERKPNGAILKQVGQQNLALGVKFCATAVLEISEHLNGLCRELSWSLNDDQKPWDESLWFPTPEPLAGASNRRDITFDLIKGDFQSFKGLWRLQDIGEGQMLTHLSYSLFIRPQVWLPVNLIQGRISKETKNNLMAVKTHAEQNSLVL